MTARLAKVSGNGRMSGEEGRKGGGEEGRRGGRREGRSEGRREGGEEGVSH